MSNLYEGQYIINSFYAINGNTNEVIEADAMGNISLSQGDKVVFKSIYTDEYVPVNTLVFFAGSDPVKVQ